MKRSAGGWQSLVATLLAATPASGLDEDLYAELLLRHTQAVRDPAGTRVDYAALGRDPEWRQLVDELADADPAAASDAAERIALWINAYNILAIDLVARHYPVSSIRDIGSLFSPVWKKEAGRLASRGVSLHQIEHEALRKQGEPRIHFAIVCASTSCPSLRREPWRAASLDAQLADASRRFLADPHKGMRLDRERRTLWLSSIFDWFEEDFEVAGGVRAFVERYAPEAAGTWLAGKGGRARIRYLDYEWDLNELRRGS